MMNSKILLFSIAWFGLVCSQSTYAQLKGVTENGGEVILYDDGTWAYVDTKVAEETEIPTNKKKFKKDDNASFLVKSKKLNVGVWIAPKAWSFTGQTDNEAAEFEFEARGKDLYAMAITESLEIPLTSFKMIALENAKGAAPDIRILQEEYRQVNGQQVLFLEMTGTIQGIKVTYLGYYYSNENGSVQLLTYTGASMIEKFRDEMEAFLNGFVTF